MIIRKGADVTLEEAISILWTDGSTTKILSEMNSDMRKVHYACYDKKKSGSKGGKQKCPTSSQPSTSKNDNSTQVCY